MYIVRDKRNFEKQSYNANETVILLLPAIKLQSLIVSTGHRSERQVATGTNIIWSRWRMRAFDQMSGKPLFYYFYLNKLNKQTKKTTTDIQKKIGTVDLAIGIY